VEPPRLHAEVRYGTQAWLLHMLRRGTLHAFIHGLKDRGFLRRRVNRLTLPT
jgi:hypothetical protein